MNQPSEKTIEVLLIKPLKAPKVIEITPELKDMQQLVGGDIEEYAPFDDEVVIICNDEGKLNGLPLNRAVYDEKGEMLDIIAGDFFLTYAPLTSESFESLPEKLKEKHAEKFHDPERFFRTNEGIKAVPFKPKTQDISL